MTSKMHVNCVSGVHNQMLVSIGQEDMHTSLLRRIIQ